MKEKRTMGNETFKKFGIINISDDFSIKERLLYAILDRLENIEMALKKRKRK